MEYAVCTQSTPTVSWTRFFGIGDRRERGCHLAKRQGAYPTPGLVRKLVYAGSGEHSILGQNLNRRQNPMCFYNPWKELQKESNAWSFNGVRCVSIIYRV